MKSKIAVLASVAFVAACLLTAPGANAQSETSEVGVPRVGFGVSIGTLGPGLEVAYEITPRINVRSGFNYFPYNLNVTTNGIIYGGSLNLQSGEVHLDYFLWRSLHVSPGLLFAPPDLLTASMNVPSGESFTLAGTQYVSGSTPVAGQAALKFNSVAPSILFGFGNLVPRGERRFSFSFEAGGAFRGSPTVPMNFAGSVCDSTGANCQSVSIFPGFQGSVSAQQTKFQNDISFLKFYPIFSIGFGFKL